MPSFKKIRPDALEPVRAHPDDAGSDLLATSPGVEIGIDHVTNRYTPREGWVECTIKPGGVACFGTGLIFEIPVGYEGQIRSRSGLGANKGLIVRQGVGTVDASYRGEVKVVLANTGDEPVVIKRKDKIAQVVVAQVSLDKWREDPDIGVDTTRGTGGFGSTDKPRETPEKSS